MTTVAVSASSSFSVLRKWRRHPIQVDVLLSTQIPARKVRCTGRGTELNGGGLAVEADIDLEIAEQVVVCFTLPGCDKPLSFRCFVRNRNGKRYGLEFIAENDSDYLNTGRLLESLADKS